MAPSKNYMLNDKFPKHIKNATSTSDGLMSSEDKAKFDELFEFGLLSLVTQETDGIMMHQDKKKLDGIEEGANNYVHPDTHPATMIVEDSSHRFTTDTEKITWNSKASKAVVTTTVNGLMSAEDKVKLDGIETGANKYIHPDTHPSTMIIEDSTHRFVTDEEKENWNSKPSTAVATPSTDGLMSIADKKKLDNIEDSANNYIHPSTHEATMIIEDSTHRFVTDDEKAAWNAKASTAVATQTDSGLMSSNDKAKLDGIQSGANKYVHPDTHPATMIVEDTTHKFVTDTEKAAWNAKASTAVVTTTANGLMTKEDKIKLNSIDSGANKYVHPDTHLPSIIAQDVNNRFVTDTEKAAWNAKASTAVVTTSANGLMSKEDKTKLDGIAEGANNYTHPDTHSATMITEDATHRFVTDEEKTKWNNGSSISLATSTSNGLMSADDKKKLDGLKEGGDIPSNIDASIITQDSTHRFVSDTEKATWNAAESNKIDSIIINGLELSIDNNKQATIPIADNSTYGAVELVKDYGSAQDNPSSVITYDFYTNGANAIREELTNIKNTIVTEVATQTTDGLMSAADKKILDDLVTTVAQINEKIKSAIYYG